MRHRRLLALAAVLAALGTVPAAAAAFAPASTTPSAPASTTPSAPGSATLSALASTTPSAPTTVRASAPATLAYKRLNIAMQAQQKSNWCWATSVKTRIQWSSGGGQIHVLYGYDNTNSWVYWGDPWPSNDRYNWAFHAWYVDNDSFSWTHSLYRIGA